MQCEVTEVKEQSGAADQVGDIGNIFGGFDGHLWFGFRGPALILDHALFKFADAGEVFIQFAAIFGAELREDGMCLIVDIVEDAASIFEAADAGLNLSRVAFQEQPRKDS